ncbi:flocculation protein FLO11-like [Sipha flava]|uniref:Flocculation protein FLO11-like n=1 Tax=Sipha flava TaxID=143950 RepID=A0A8B8FCC6_9HEMI|nr:flocculation protein FLO11-like [Sipha flava]
MADFVILVTVTMVSILTKVGNAGVRSISSCGLFGINPDSMDLLPNTEYTSALSSPLPLPTSVSTFASILASKPSPNLILTPASNEVTRSFVSTSASNSFTESTTHRLLSSAIHSSVVPPSTSVPLLASSSSISTTSTSSEYTSTPLSGSKPTPATRSSNTAPLQLPSLTPTTSIPLFSPISTPEQSFASNLSQLLKPFLTEFPSSTSSPVPPPDLFIPSQDTMTPSNFSSENNIKLALLELLLKLSTELDQQ